MKTLQHKSYSVRHRMTLQHRSHSVVYRKTLQHKSHSVTHRKTLQHKSYSVRHYITSHIQLYTGRHNSTGHIQLYAGRHYSTNHIQMYAGRHYSISHILHHKLLVTSTAALIVIPSSEILNSLLTHLLQTKARPSFTNFTKKNLYVGQSNDNNFFPANLMLVSLIQLCNFSKQSHISHIKYLLLTNVMSCCAYNCTEQGINFVHTLKVFIWLTPSSLLTPITNISRTSLFSN
jgi:hypothetical protein